MCTRNQCKNIDCCVGITLAVLVLGISLFVLGALLMFTSWTIVKSPDESITILLIGLGLLLGSLIFIIPSLYFLTKLPIIMCDNKTEGDRMCSCCFKT